MTLLNIVKVNFPFDYARLEQRKLTNMLVIHHTGNPKDDDLGVKEINRSHQNQGWTCIGYHYVVRKDGTIEDGRAHWTVGSHSYGDNSHTIGIHVSGNFEKAEPTEAQIESLSMLVSAICNDYMIPINKHTVVAHKDLMSTACCGKNLYNKLDEVRGKAIWYQKNK